MKFGIWASHLFTTFYTVWSPDLTLAQVGANLQATVILMTSLIIYCIGIPRGKS